MAVRIEGKGKDLCVRNSQTPRFDLHVRLDFSKQTNPDAELWLEIWDYDAMGQDDQISCLSFDAMDVRERCCTTIASRKQGKFPLECIPGAKGQELKWGVGSLTVQFKLKENVNLQVEAQKKLFGRTKEQYIQNKIRAARVDFAV